VPCGSRCDLLTVGVAAVDTASAPDSLIEHRRCETLSPGLRGRGFLFADRN
jgi:hypothetical protein